jgi:cytochrome c553
MSSKHFLLLSLALLAAPLAQADEPAKTAQSASRADPAKGQKIASGVCVACHNADGNSIISTNPKLAGQGAEYLYKQLKNFKSIDGKPAERSNAVMGGMVLTLSSDEDMRNAAAWYASQTQKGGQAKNKDTIELGQKLYRGGDLAKGLPSCAGCHGPAGAGIPAQYPRIGGQHADYIEAQLKTFRSGERANDPNKMMRLVAIKMTDAEIKAVADYIAGLH